MGLLTYSDDGSFKIAKSDTTALDGDYIIVDTSSNTVTISVSHHVRGSFRVRDLKGTFATRNCIVSFESIRYPSGTMAGDLDLGGALVGGVVMRQNKDDYTFGYDNASGLWYAMNNNSSDLPRRV